VGAQGLDVRQLVGHVATVPVAPDVPDGPAARLPWSRVLPQA
jgi:hypothetical protein